MNETIKEFLKSLNINFDKFDSLDGSQVKSGYDVNPILSRFNFYKPTSENKKVSIEDIIGYDYRSMSLGDELLDNLSRFFDRDGDGYHTRSISMLDIPQGQVISQLENSFQREPMCLVEVEKGIYNIGTNGLHRFHVIKTHYLNELSKLNPNDKTEIKKLKEKYSFDAKVSEVDFVKSYSAFLLNILDRDLAVELHYNSDYELTGKSCLIDYSKDGEKVILSDDQLLEVVNKKINQFSKTASRFERKQFNELVKNASKFESFQNYYNVILKENQSGGLEWN